MDKEIWLAALYAGYYFILGTMCLFIILFLPMLWALTEKWYNPWHLAKKAFWYNLEQSCIEPLQNPPSKTGENHDEKEDSN